MIQFKQFYDTPDKNAIDWLNEFVRDNKITVVDYKYQVIVGDIRAFAYILLQYKVEE